LQEAQRWVAAHPAEDHGVERLASRTGMSPRHFARVFRAETGMTPAAYVETVRIEAGRRLLGSGDVALKQVAVPAASGMPTRSGAPSSGVWAQRLPSTGACTLPDEARP
jgi:transcriptional regulator GlxA family with amidase domain